MHARAVSAVYRGSQPRLGCSLQRERLVSGERRMYSVYTHRDNQRLVLGELMSLDALSDGGFERRQ